MERRNAYDESNHTSTNYSNVYVLGPNEVATFRADFPLLGVYNFTDVTLSEATFSSDAIYYISIRDNDPGVQRLKLYTSVSQDGVFFTEFTDGDADYLNTYVANKPLKPNHFVSVIFNVVNETNEKSVFKNLSIEFSITKPESTPYFDRLTCFKGLSRINRDSLQLTANVLNKVVKPGIVPEFVKRGLNEKWEDEDFFSFFEELIYVPALWNFYLKYFRDFIYDRNFTREYLAQRNLTATFESEDALYYLVTHYYNEMRRRGTNLVFEERYELPADTYVSEETWVRGEFLRLLNIDDMSSIEMYRLEGDDTEWFIDQSSPGYMSPTSEKGSIKAYGKGIYDLGDLENDYFSTNIVELQNVQVQLSATSYRAIGDAAAKVTTRAFTAQVNVEGIIGEQLRVPALYVPKLIKVNPNLSYEVVFTFAIKEPIDLVGLGVNCYDDFGSPVTRPLKINDEYTESAFFVENFNYSPINVNNVLSPVTVRGILFAYGSPRLMLSRYHYGPYLTIGEGTHLKFSTLTATRICPYMLLTGSYGTTNAVQVIDIKVRLLAIPQATYLGKDSFFYIRGMQGSGHYSTEQALTFTSKYLTPYNVEIINED
jgi:hypothetical protein